MQAYVIALLGVMLILAGLAQGIYHRSRGGTMQVAYVPVTLGVISLVSGCISFGLGRLLRATTGFLSGSLGFIDRIPDDELLVIFATSTAISVAISRRSRSGK